MGNSARGQLGYGGGAQGVKVEARKGRRSSALPELLWLSLGLLQHILSKPLPANMECMNM